MTFLTVEDVNEVLYNNQNFWWHEIDTAIIDSTGDKEYSNIKIDFCKVTKVSSGGSWKYTVVIDNDYYTGLFCTISKNNSFMSVNLESQLSNSFTMYFAKSYDYSPIKFELYMGIAKSEPHKMSENIITNLINLNLKELKSPQNIQYKRWGWGDGVITISRSLNVGINEIKDNWNQSIGFVLVNLVKTDFQFQCNQQLTLGKVNTVKLGAVTDYKPNGDMIGSNVPNITINYNNISIPVSFDSTLNDYIFDIDLTNKQSEGKLRLKVFIESNDVLNASETDIVLNASFETINNESKLKTLFKNGGIGRIGANITLTSDIIVDNDVLIIGNAKTINMNAHKFIVPSEKTFKAENTIFTNGYNTIQQNINSDVELSNCEFRNCQGFGSVIDCQTNLSSLTVEDDFITNITACTFDNNDMCILHGGDLNVTGCTVNGKIGNANNPYFLYQTDGEATILQSSFKLQSNTQIESDIEFNACIFVCGETAIVNGYSHEELQQNNISSFITSPQNNASKINVTYYYPAVEDYITLESSNGYCHACSGIDFVFKNNVTARRE